MISVHPSIQQNEICDTLETLFEQVIANATYSPNPSYSYYRWFASRFAFCANVRKRFEDWFALKEKQCFFLVWQQNTIRQDVRKKRMASERKFFVKNILFYHFHTLNLYFVCAKIPVSYLHTCKDFDIVIL